MNTIQKSCFNSKLEWIPKIDNNLFDNIVKLMRDAVNKDPLSFYNPECPGYPNWKVINKSDKSDFLLINISDTHQINIYLIYRYELDFLGVDHIDIQENWYVKGQPYSRRAAIVSPLNYVVSWINNIYTQNHHSETEMSINRVTDALIKLGLAECRNTQ